MKNALVKIISVVLTLAAVVVAVGLFKPTSALTEGNFNIDVLLWNLSEESDAYRVGLENGLDSNGGATITVDSTNANLLHIETKLPQAGEQNPVLKLYRNKKGQTFSEDTKNLIGDQASKADMIAEVEFDKEEIKTWTGETKVQIFEGVHRHLTSVSQHVPAKQYFVLNKEKTNVFTLYLSITGPEETLGTYGWGGYEGLATGTWGNEVGFYNFNVAAELKGKKIAVSHITNDNTEGGYIVMNKAGSDQGKLTGNIDKNIITGDFTPNTSKFIAVVGKGGGYTKNDNVYTLENIPQAAQDAFSFAFVPEKITPLGLGGTTAKDKRTIFASTSIAVQFEGTTPEEKQMKLKEWFKVTVKDSKEVVEIQEVQTSLSETKSSEFIIILNSDLDNTKEYVLSFDNKKEGEEAQKTQIDLATDKAAPVIEFIDLEEDGKVEVPYNEEFDFTLIPKYTVTDDRDGDISQQLYVPGANENNEKRFIDPGKEGEYEVLFRVVDTWGNVSEKIITFVVAKK